MPQSSVTLNFETQFIEDSLLAPGPVNLHPEVRRILSLPMIHHRTPEFDKILSEVFSGLKNIFETKEQVFMHTSTGSGGMESLLINPLSFGDHVLIVNSGKFGERWVEMAKTFKANVTEIKIPWGEVVTPEQIEKALIENPRIRIVLTQACETSTAVFHPIEAIGKVVHRYPETLFLVDGITAAGALPLPMDAWHIDGLVAGSQKALMLPTGLSFVCFSQKAWEFIKKSDIPKFYFDIIKEKKSNDKGETWFSSVVPLIRALNFVLKDIQSKGLAKHFNEIHRRAEFCRTFIPQLGFQIFTKFPSDSVSAFFTPTAIDSQKLRDHLEKKYRITIMGGQDQAKGKIIRIGHMGYIQDQELLNLIYALGNSLIDFEFETLNSEKLLYICSTAEKWLKDNE